MTLEENLIDLCRHADDLARCRLALGSRGPLRPLRPL